MNGQNFNEIVETQIKRSTDMLVKKADEYATDADRLHNFTVAAHLTGETRAQAAAGFMVKHTVSVYDMINSGEPYPQELWDEKITDHINYLLLLRAIVEEDLILENGVKDLKIALNVYPALDDADGIRRQAEELAKDERIRRG